MATELQSLLDKIQTEGIAKAEGEAKIILEEAREKATAIVDEAKREKARAEQAAQAAARDFQTRAEQSVRQAARDVVLGVRAAVQDTLDRVLLSGIRETLREDALSDLILEAVRAYIAASSGSAAATVKVPEAQAAGLRGALLDKARSVAKDGLEIRADRAVRGGFRVTLADGRVEHDFSEGAIREALAGLLRPTLAELLEEK